MISRFNSNPHSAAYECSDGVFVLYADYEALEAKLATLVVESKNYLGIPDKINEHRLKAAIAAAKVK